jgi:hypothetical protein
LAGRLSTSSVTRDETHFCPVRLPRKTPSGGFLCTFFGLEWSLSRWAMELGRDRHIAAGILIATLALLETRDAGRRSAA